MILAAGEGTRLRPYTLTLPKPAIPFLGVPLIDYGLRLLNELGPCDLVVNHHHLSQEILKLFHNPLYGRRNIHFSDEREVLLDSGGGVHKAQPILETEDHFVVMNGDELILPHESGQIAKAYDAHVRSGRIATLLVMDHPLVGKKFGGVWCNVRHEVTLFSKTPLPGLKGWHYIGILFLARRVFNSFKSGLEKENLLYDTLTTAMSKGETVGVIPIRTEWFETGNPTDFIQASETCLNAMNTEPSLPWARDLKEFVLKHEMQAPLVEQDQALLVKTIERLYQNKN
jgi:mannose-1-phosphate guanylyltransferase